MSDKLRKWRLISALPDERVRQLESHVTWRTYKRGDRLFNEGETDGKMYVIASGRVKVVKEFPNGKNAIMGIFGPGGAVAEIVGIDRLPYPASAIAMEDTEAGAIPGEVFANFLKSNPDAMLRMIVGLGNKLREFADNLGSLAVQSVEKRLARFLVRMGAQIGKKTKEGIEVNLPMTRQDLAEVIGTSFEVVERSLKKMRENGVLKVEGKNITILDLENLKAIFGEME